MGGEADLKQAFFDEVIILKATTHFLSSLLVVLLQVLQLLALQRLLVKHIGIEERADIFIVALEALQDQQRRNYKENLRLPALQLLRE